jgi:soluble lytic murein transglycosylase
MTAFAVPPCFRRRGAVGVAAAAMLAFFLLLGLGAVAAEDAQARPAATPAPAKARPASAALTAEDRLVIDARDAFSRHDKARLAADRAAALAASHPLAPWVDYWDLSSRLPGATVAEVEAFYLRWPGSYVEDRLRNDWLLELGRRRDWEALIRDLPRFRMNDDREVSCYGLLAEHLTQPQHGDLHDAALAAWQAQREPDDGCTLLAAALRAAGVFGDDDLWRRARLAAEFNRLPAARVAAGLVPGAVTADIDDALNQPLKRLRRPSAAPAPDSAAMHLDLLALIRVAANDPDAAAGLLGDRWQARLPARWAAWAWAVTGKQAALKLSADAPGHYQRAWALLSGVPAGASPWLGSHAVASGWSADTLAWAARCALRRTDDAADRWPRLLTAIDALPMPDSQDPAWTYWRARALAGMAPNGPPGNSQREAARALLAASASPLHFYGRLAAEEVGAPLGLPDPPPPLTAPERRAAADHPGLSRALRLVGLGLRDEARREWNFSLRGMGDRELLAAAQRACDVQDWQLCINTSERTRLEVDVAQRYPLPFATEVAAAVQGSAAVDAPFVMGVIRQETRFMPQLGSAVGASGLMQLMPKTAKWLVRKLALPAGTADRLFDPDASILLGTAYLKMLVDDFAGSQALATAAYNAGPSRPRRWREGPALEPAAWIENIPFSETRDYVKKVLANADVYASRMNPASPPLPLTRRLGTLIAPRPPGQPAPDTDLP